MVKFRQRPMWHADGFRQVIRLTLFECYSGKVSTREHDIDRHLYVCARNEMAFRQLSVWKVPWSRVGVSDVVECQTCYWEVAGLQRAQFHAMQIISNNLKQCWRSTLYSANSSSYFQRNCEISRAALEGLVQLTRPVICMLTASTICSLWPWMAT